MLFGHPKVQEVAVIAYPDDRLGELTAWLEEAGMAKQFWPERIELVESMPKTASGKVQKFELRRRFAQGDAPLDQIEP